MPDPLHRQPTPENDPPSELHRLSAIQREETLALPSHEIQIQRLKHLATHLHEVVCTRLSTPKTLPDVFFEDERIFYSLVHVSQTPIAERAFSTIERAVAELPCYRKLAIDITAIFAHVLKLPGSTTDYEKLVDFIFAQDEISHQGKTRFEYISGYFQELQKSKRCYSVSQSTFIDFLTHGYALLSSAGTTANACTLAGTILGKLIGHRGSFQGANFILPLLLGGVKDEGLVLHTLECGLAVGDPPEQLALVASDLSNVMWEHDLNRLHFSSTIGKFRETSISILPFLSTLSHFSREYSSHPQFEEAFDRFLIVSRILLDQKIPHTFTNHTFKDEKFWKRICFSETSAFKEDFASHASQVSDCLLKLKMRAQEGNEVYSKVAQLITIPPSHEKLSVLNHILGLPHFHITDFNCAVSLLCDLAFDENLPPQNWSDLQRLIHSQIQKGKNVEDLLLSLEKVRKLETNRQHTHTCKWDEYFRVASQLTPTLSDLAAITPNVVTFYRSITSQVQLDTAHELFQLAYTLRDQGHSAKHHITEIADTLFSSSGVGELYLCSLNYHKSMDREDSRLIRSFLDLPLSEDLAWIQALRECVRWQISNYLPLIGVFTAFASLTNTHRPSAQEWREIHVLISQLVRDQIPLTYLSSALLQKYIRTPLHQRTHNEIANHLFTLSRIKTSHETFSIAESLDEVLLLISQQGPSTYSAAVIEKLLIFTGGESLEPLRELWEIHGLPSQEGWFCILENIKEYAASGLSPFHLCRDITLIDKQISGNELTRGILWRDCRTIISHLNNSFQKNGTVGLPLTLLTLSFIEEFSSWNPSQRSHALSLLESFSRLYHSVATSEKEWEYGDTASVYRTEIRNYLTYCISSIPNVLGNSAISQKITLIVDNGKFHSISQFSHILRDVHAYASTLQLRDTNPKLQALASSHFAEIFHTSQGIYHSESDEARAHFNSTMRIIDRAFRDYAGFGGSALSSRRPPRTDTLEPVAPMIVRFGMHSANRTYILNSSNNDSFPGKGVCIEGLRTERVFRTDPYWRELKKNSPHWQWLESDGLFGNSYFHSFDMEELSECSFIQLRGLEIVLPPPRSKFQIDGIGYGYLFYNRHFAPFPEIALGVPVTLIKDLFGNSFIPAEDFTGFDSRRIDISKVDLSYEGIKELCRKRRLPLLNLTYGSVVGSGLCNAPLPKTEPYYGWELLISGGHLVSDAWGHVHKSILQNYPHRSGATFNEQSRLAKELHQKIYNYFHQLQDYRTGLRFAFSFYKMGTTFTNDLEVAEHASRAQPLSNSDQEHDTSQLSVTHSFPVQEELTVHPYQYRMLEEVYRYHLGGITQGWRQHQFPILHFPITLRPDILPSRRNRLFSIDTGTLDITLQNRKIPLSRSGNGFGEDERKVWREVILPIFKSHSIGWDPTFLLPET